MKSLRAKSQQNGMALIMAMWVIVLVTILLGGFAVLAKTEMMQSRFLFDTTTARYAADAGISRAVYELRRSDLMQRWAADGRPYQIQFDDIEIELRITDESGKIDINAADEITLLRMFESVGVNPDEAAALVDAVSDWRDADDLVRANGAEANDYESAGYDYVPSNKPFVLASELLQVMGVNVELYRQLEAIITVHAGSSSPNFGFAPARVLQIMPDVTPEMAQQLVEQRQAFRPGDPAGQALLLPNGSSLSTGAGGSTYTVRSRATLSSGAWTEVEAIIQLGGQPGTRAFSILQWREGSAE